MGRGLLLVVVAGALLFTTTTANAAGYVSGNDLYRMCRGNIDEQWNCIGYLEAAADAMSSAICVGSRLPIKLTSA
jgi:hypothetical protein